MKMALLSDVHGNLPALEAVLQDMKDFHPDILAVAGDLTGGPYSNEVIQTLKDQHAAMIVGNTDLDMLQFVHGEAHAEWQTHRQFGLVLWNARNLTEINCQFLSGLPEQRVVSLPGTDAVHLVHGSPRDPNEAIFPDRDLPILDLSLQMIAEPVLVCGHTHDQWASRRNGKLAVNPGSVAAPLNGVIGAQYARMIWEDRQWQVKPVTVHYDLAALKKGFAESGFLQEAGAAGRSFLLTIETGRNVMLEFRAHAFKLAEQEGFKNCKAVPNEIWAQADATFPWESYRQ
jgi:putative phosphoesterase